MFVDRNDERGLVYIMPPIDLISAQGLFVRKCTTMLEKHTI